MSVFSLFHTRKDFSQPAAGTPLQWDYNRGHSNPPWANPCQKLHPVPEDIIQRPYLRIGTKFHFFHTHKDFDQPEVGTPTALRLHTGRTQTLREQGPARNYLTFSRKHPKTVSSYWDHIFDENGTNLSGHLAITSKTLSYFCCREVTNDTKSLKITFEDTLSTALYSTKTEPGHHPNMKTQSLSKKTARKPLQNPFISTDDPNQPSTNPRTIENRAPRTK